MTRRLFPFRWLLLAALALPLGLGCSGDGVRVYETPYEKQRLLGAMVLTDQTTWFFKLMGRAEDVAANRDDYLKFLKSLRFPADPKQPVTWELPAEWKAELAGPTGMGIRYASIYIPRGQVVSVSLLSSDGGSPLANINRWRDQLRLPRKTNGEELLKDSLQIETADGHDARVVDLESPRTVAEPTKPLDYKVPAGWTEATPQNEMTAARFRVEGAGQSADVTITKLGGTAGGIAANVNRWRGQVGLDPASEEQIKKDSQEIEVAGVKSVLVDLAGPQGKRMLAVISSRGGTTWFVKMLGPTDLVGKQRPAFESFVRSLKFGGGL